MLPLELSIFTLKCRAVRRGFEGFQLRRHFSNEPIEARSGSKGSKAPTQLTGNSSCTIRSFPPHTLPYNLPKFVMVSERVEADRAVVLPIV